MFFFWGGDGGGFLDSLLPTLIVGGIMSMIIWGVFNAGAERAGQAGRGVGILGENGLLNRMFQAVRRAIPQIAEWVRENLHTILWIVVIVGLMVGAGWFGPTSDFVFDGTTDRRSRPARR
jgi:hypothetical protein